jgi:hypothetical protein
MRLVITVLVSYNVQCIVYNAVPLHWIPTQSPRLASAYNLHDSDTADVFVAKFNIRNGRFHIVAKTSSFGEDTPRSP